MISYIKKITLFFFNVLICTNLFSQTDCMCSNSKTGLQHDYVGGELYYNFDLRAYNRELCFIDINNVKDFQPALSTTTSQNNTISLFPIKFENDTAFYDGNFNSIYISNFGCHQLTPDDIKLINSYDDIRLLFIPSTSRKYCDIDFSIYDSNLKKISTNYKGFKKLSHLILYRADSSFTSEIDTLKNVSFLKVSSHSSFDFGKFPNIDTLILNIGPTNKFFNNNNLTKVKYVNLDGNMPLSNLYQFTKLKQLKYTLSNGNLLMNDSINVLNKLVELDIKLIRGGLTLQRGIHLDSLETLRLTSYFYISFPQEVSFKNLKTLVFGGQIWQYGAGLKTDKKSILELPQNLSKLNSIEYLTIAGKHEIINLESIYNLKNIKSLGFYYCIIPEIPYKIGSYDSLEQILIIGCKVESKDIVKLIKYIDHPVMLQFSEVELTEDVLKAISKNKNITHLRIDAAMFNELRDYSMLRYIRKLEISTSPMWFFIEKDEKKFCISERKYKSIKRVLPEIEIIFFSANNLYGVNPKYLEYYQYEINY